MLEQKFIGSLLGLALGDAVGSYFEGQPPDWIRKRFPTREAFFRNLPDTPWGYTDDTQMMIGVAEALVQDRAIVEPSLCAAFVANYDPGRGYGRGARVVLNAMDEGKDYRRLSNELFPGGSYGNGAAMRVAPVGALFHDNQPQLLEQARLSSLPTHVHPLGIEGAQLIASAVGWCVPRQTFDKAEFFASLHAVATEPLYQQKLALAQQAQSLEDLEPLGNGIAAQDSAVTAIACFALHPDSFTDVVASSIFLGGDTDTIAAMAGAISGAYLGVDAIPPHWIDSLEDWQKGRKYVVELGKKLYETWQGMQC